MNGVKKVEILFNPELVKIKFGEKQIPQNDIIETLSKLGYPAKGNNSLIKNIKSYINCIIRKVKKIINIIIFLNLACLLHAHDFNQFIVDSQKQDTILVEYCTKTIFNKFPYKSWFIPKHKLSIPKNVLKLKKQSSKNFTSKLFLVHSSNYKEQLPHFCSITIN